LQKSPSRLEMPQRGGFPQGVAQKYDGKSIKRRGKKNLLRVLKAAKEESNHFNNIAHARPLRMII